MERATNHPQLEATLLSDGGSNGNPRERLTKSEDSQWHRAESFFSDTEAKEFSVGKRKRISFALGYFALIIVVGTVSFHFIEGWAWADALYFWCNTTMTVGFGDLSPTPGLRFLTAFLIINSMVATSLVLSWVMDQVVDLHLSSKGVPDDFGLEDDPNYLKKALFYQVGRSVAIFFIFLFLSAFVFYFLEGWSYGDSLYFVVVASSSTGIGDFVPSSEASRLVTGLWVIGGAIITSHTTFSISHLLVEYEVEVRRHRFLKDTLLTTTFGGEEGFVSEAEFLAWVLTRTNAVAAHQMQMARDVYRQFQCDRERGIEREKLGMAAVQFNRRQTERLVSPIRTSDLNPLSSPRSPPQRAESPYEEAEEADKPTDLRGNFANKRPAFRSMHSSPQIRTTPHQQSALPRFFPSVVAAHRATLRFKGAAEKVRQQLQRPQGDTAAPALGSWRSPAVMQRGGVSPEGEMRVEGRGQKEEREEGSHAFCLPTSVSVPSVLSTKRAVSSPGKGKTQMVREEEHDGEGV
uniref:Potassium channel domain-containing protein n=1 Tax=Chromera velia CCMP2878 TaxID=1169474 RepID=A0A0G4GCX7_9ALVE|eukprot:Cvel_4490.t1-p1 / transcript=Cvel_4490.t1 / gene=Cvel_4490 / organism=Chromera_velia_CCMP2878 / gene_product=hypothetical protein / transcript_product=hypothetical protein / location=Cvel_scaffold196:84967-90801(-) / protein_length=518 / sequence_SO=supercontig / SO=protein_coding / is_pseudo=false